MTAIEFFDRTPLENVVSFFLPHPDKIVFIGNSNEMKRFKPIYEEFVQQHGLEVVLDFKHIDKNDINDIIEKLSAIVEQEDQCVFDLTGGEDLVLVAMGIVYEKFAHKNVRMQRFNIRNGVVIDCDNDGAVLLDENPEISVEENVRIHGGAVRFNDEENTDKTYRWDLTEDFLFDVDCLWEICRNNPGRWNKRLNLMERIEEMGGGDDTLDVSANVSILQWQINDLNLDDFLTDLAREGLIRGYSYDGIHIAFSFKNAQIKRCLITAGMVLELKVWITARSLMNADGTPLYSDTLNGVHIDWDGALHAVSDQDKDTENEIDVMLMHGMVPLFVSCKNGHIESEELYKLDAVASRFGGVYVKKVLIATDMERGRHGTKSFRQRAKDMQIKLIDKVHELEDHEFEEMVKNLINV